MKRLMIICLSLTAPFAFSQKRVVSDPSFSSRNYKHANKAVVAKKQNLEKVTALQSVLVQGGPEYKHRYNQSFLLVKGGMNTKRISKSRKGYKHPLGL